MSKKALATNIAMNLMVIKLSAIREIDATGIQI